MVRETWVQSQLNLFVVAIEKGAFWSSPTTVANFTNQAIGQMNRVFANGPGNLGSIPAESFCSSYWKGGLRVTLN